MKRKNTIISFFMITWSLFGLGSSSSKDALHHVQLKLSQQFGRGTFLNLGNVISLFRNYLPLETGVTLHLNKLESPFPKDALCQDCLKLAMRLIGKRFSISSMNFRNYLPLKKSVTLHLNKLEFPSPQNALCQVEIGPVVHEKKIFQFCQCYFAIL